MDTWGREQGQQFVERHNRALAGRQPVVYGSSVEGYPLHLYLPEKWSDYRTLVLAGIHGEEVEGTNVLSYALRSIKAENLRCAVILCANPDGAVHGTRGNAHNVDLNRNFPSPNWRSGKTATRWELDLPRDVELSTGNFAGSEPEVKALMQVIAEQHIERIISIHAPLACVDYEQAVEWALPQVLSKRLNLPLVADVGYPHPGSMDSWSKEVGLPLVTVEIEETISLSAIRRKYGPVLQDVLTANI